MEKLQEQGWYLSEQGFDLVSNCGSIDDLQTLVSRAVNMDLREIVNNPESISSGKNLVLQIQKVRNVAAPKINQESRGAPRMLKFSLTDGKENYQAVEMDQIANLSINTPPGTKIMVKGKGIMLTHGFVLLRSPDIVKVLGGKVTNLVEKWELNRKLAAGSRLRTVKDGGPPPWIPFGKKIIKVVAETDKNFKALSAAKDTAEKETTEFEVQRQDAIAEAARLGGKKIFGGGNKQLLDHSVQRIVDQGFSVKQAEYALKMSQNNIDRALKSLQQTSENRFNSGWEPRESCEPRSKRFEKKVEETKPSSGKVSLFDFLEDKLPAQSNPPESHGNLQQQQQQQHHHHQQHQHHQHQHHNQRFNENSGNHRLENQFDRLELRGSEYSHAGKGGRAQRGGRGYQTPPRHVVDESKYSKRQNTDGNGYNSFSTSNSGFGNAHQVRRPRLQRNQETHGNRTQQDNTFKSNNYSRSSQMNERKSSSVFVQPGGEIGASNTDMCPNANKGNQRFNDEMTVKNNQQPDRYQQTQQVDNAPKSRHATAAHDSSYNKQNRGQHDGIRRATHGNPNSVDKNDKNQSNRPIPTATVADNYGMSCTSDNEPSSGSWVWKLGDDCMAKYWEDNRYYNAQVTAISERTCVVRFKDFDNYEEVLQADCIPITDVGLSLLAFIQKPQEISTPALGPNRASDHRNYGNRNPRYDQTETHISGMEFRRGGSGGGGSGGSGGNIGSKGYNRKRGQQRSSQPIYQPPAQRGHSTWSPRDNSQL